MHGNVHVRFGNRVGALERIENPLSTPIHLYNGGPYQLIVCHFFIGICAYMGREWERAKLII